jgi:hypothetical protein
MNTILARYRSMPRVLRWAMWAGVILIAYLVVIDPLVIAKASQLHARARDMATRLVALDHDVRTGRTRDVSNAIARYGVVAPPSGDPERATQVFNATIYDILNKHGVKRYTSPSRSAPMGPGPLTRTVATDERAERRIADIQFEAAPEEIAAILADMERAPQISAVSRVQVRKADKESASRELQTTITAETWVITKKGRAAGGASR